MKKGSRMRKWLIVGTALCLSLLLVAAAVASPISFGTQFETSGETHRSEIMADEANDNLESSSGKSGEKNNPELDNGGSDMASSDSSSTINGGDYGHLWYLTGRVLSVGDGLIEVIADEEGDALYSVDTSKARRNGMMAFEVKEGDKVRVSYFLYDRDSSIIKAYGIQLLSSESV